MSAATVPTATDRAARIPTPTSPGLRRARAERGAVGPADRGYHDLVTAVHQSIVPAGASVLEIGSGGGDLLAALAPGEGVGVDVSPGMVELARARIPSSASRSSRASTSSSASTFDYIVLSDLLPYVDDLLALFGNVARHSHRDTRIVVHSYSQLWRPALRILELLRLRPRNADAQLGDAAGRRQPAAARGARAGDEDAPDPASAADPASVRVLNGFLANLRCIRHLCLTYWIVARVQPRRTPRARASRSSCRRRTRRG